MSTRFRFRLDPVLAHRERLVEECRRAFALKERDLADAEAEAQRLQIEREAQRAALTADHARFDVDRLRATYAHLAFLDRAIDEHAERVAACRAEAVRAQQQLVVAERDRKVLETLKERRYETFAADAAQADQLEVDDQNARRYARAQKHGANES
jgi:flagellar FliJ protein